MGCLIGQRYRVTGWTTRGGTDWTTSGGTAWTTRGLGTIENYMATTWETIWELCGNAREPSGHYAGKVWNNLETTRTPN